MGNITVEGNNEPIPKDYLIKQAIDDYLSCNVPDFKGMKKVSYLRKTINEKRIKSGLEKLVAETKPYRAANPEELSPGEIEEIKKTIVSYLFEFDKKKYFFDRPFLTFFIDRGYLNIAEEFIFRAKKEDSHLKSIEIFQAIRNVWIMNSLQIIWAIPLEMTPSIYGYSMLYPYTDNFLDDPHIDMVDKDNFNHKLRKMLKGEEQTPDTAHENRVFELIRKIESQYDRHKYAQVYESVLLIQEAQVESLSQDQNTRMMVDDILPISFSKGGSSVLADAFLVKGNLSNDEMKFSFGYGTFLQLLDDLQDTIEDRKEGHQTIFSIQDKYEVLDEHINKLIAYIFKVNTPRKSESETMILMKEIISSCTLIMVMDAVGRNHTLVSKELYRKLESFSKVRLSFYKELELRLNDYFEYYAL